MDHATLEPTTQGENMHPGPGDPDTRGVTTRTFSGRRVIAVLGVIVVVTLVFNYLMATRNADSAEIRAVDVAVVADTSQTSQTWKPQPDGMIATFTAVDDDDEVVARIRRNLKFRRTEYLRANYSDPKFGNAQIAGRAVLEFGTSHDDLNCRYRDVAGGGELQWITTDAVMLDSLKEWAAVVASGPVG